MLDQSSTCRASSKRQSQPKHYQQQMEPADSVNAEFDLQCLEHFSVGKSTDLPPNMFQCGLDGIKALLSQLLHFQPSEFPQPTSAERASLSVNLEMAYQEIRYPKILKNTKSK